jgi:hypothetical protein
MIRVTLTDELATDATLMDAKKNIASLEADLANQKQTLTNREQTLKTHEGGNDAFHEHQAKIKKLDQLKKLEASKFQGQAAGMMIGEAKSAQLLEAEAKLQQLKDLDASSRPAHTPNLKDNKIQAEIKAEANKLAQAELDLRKANLPEPGFKPSMAIKEAEGFGKAWQKTGELKTNGFAELAKHAETSKWAGIKAGALTFLIGGGLTLQQLAEAGKAQDASNVREARLDQLRKQQQMGA